MKHSRIMDKVKAAADVVEVEVIDVDFEPGGTIAIMLKDNYQFEEKMELMVAFMTAFSAFTFPLKPVPLMFIETPNLIGVRLELVIIPPEVNSN